MYNYPTYSIQPHLLFRGRKGFLLQIAVGIPMGPAINGFALFWDLSRGKQVGDECRKQTRANNAC